MSLARTPIQTRHVNGTTIAYRDEGAGPVVVLIHGLGADSSMMQPQVSALSGPYRAIAIDARGNGHSGRLTGPVRSILDRQTDDLAALLWVLEIKRATVCGVSYGGVFAMHFAMRHPTMVEGLVLVDTFSDCHGVDLRSRSLEWLTWATLPLLFAPRALSHLVRAGLREWPEAAEHMAASVRRYRSWEVILQRMAISLADHTPRLPEIEVDVLAVAGGRSQATVDRMSKIAREVPSGRIEVVPDSMDPTTLLQPEPFNALLLGFLSRAR